MGHSICTQKSDFPSSRLETGMPPEVSFPTREDRNNLTNSPTSKYNTAAHLSTVWTL